MNQRTDKWDPVRINLGQNLEKTNERFQRYLKMDRCMNRYEPKGWLLWTQSCTPGGPKFEQNETGLIIFRSLLGLAKILSY